METNLYVHSVRFKITFLFSRIQSRQYTLRENRPLMTLNFQKERQKGIVNVKRPFLRLGKVTFDNHVNALERY